MVPNLTKLMQHAYCLYQCFCQKNPKKLAIIGKYDEVVCFGEEKQQPDNTSKPQTWSCCPKTDCHRLK